MATASAPFAEPSKGTEMYYTLHPLETIGASLNGDYRRLPEDRDYYGEYLEKRAPSCGVGVTERQLFQYARSCQPTGQPGQFEVPASLIVQRSVGWDWVHLLADGHDDALVKVACCLLAMHGYCGVVSLEKMRHDHDWGNVTFWPESVASQRIRGFSWDKEAPVSLRRKTWPGIAVAPGNTRGKGLARKGGKRKK